MSPEHDTPDETRRGVLSGVLILVLAGAALGIGYNTLLLAAGPTKGLAWVRVERALASLEDLVAVRDSGGVAVPDAVDAPPPAGEAPPAGATSTRVTAPATVPAPDAGSAKSPTPVPAPASSVAPATPEPVAASPNAPPSAAAAPVIPDMREPLEAKYEIVRALWDANAAVFVDARTAPEYREERIARAVSLPLDDLGQHPELVTNFSSGGKPVVVYCGGGECELSKNLAWNLVDAGHRKVLVYLGGIAEWKQRGAPVTTGEPGAGR